MTEVEYLEFITPNVDAMCTAYETSLGISFGDPIPELGNARTSQTGNGTVIAVRQPMHDQEYPLCRPYLRVANLETSVAAAKAAGAEVALDGMDMPGRGKIAIYFLDGVQHGLWEPAE